MEKSERDKEEEEEIWSWGAGTDGQLGTTRLEDEQLPQLLLDLPSSFFSVGLISLLACGGAHVLALTTDGKVVTWGRGTSGQLGHGDMVSIVKPKHVKSLENLVITHVSTGWSHSGFVSDTGCLFTCGDGSFGQLGHGDCNSHCSPLKVSYFDSKHVDQIACGMRHSLVFMKGDGHLYTWGRGFGSTSDVHCPRRLPSSLCFIQVALGWNHMLVLTGGGEVFMLGGNHHGVLGDPQKGSLVKHLCEEESRGEALVKVQGLDGSKVVQIAAGAEHSALLTENKVIKTWGWGEHGQLGLGSTYDQIIPQAVPLGNELPRRHSMIKVYCGSGFTFAIIALCT